jgi:hypothetical protein
MILVMKNKIFGFLTIFAAFLFIGVGAGTNYSQAADGTISGKVLLSKELKDKVGPTAVLYIVARPNGMTAGPPTAVKRIPGPIQFPVSFEIGASDRMMPDGPFAGQFTIMARISQSGSASPVSPGDLIVSQPANGVSPGGKPVSLKIDQEKK